MLIGGEVCNAANRRTDQTTHNPLCRSSGGTQPAANGATAAKLTAQLEPEGIAVTATTVKIATPKHSLMTVPQNRPLAAPHPTRNE